MIVQREREADGVAFERFVRNANDGRDGAHDIGHLRRVLGNAFSIAERLDEPVDGRVLHAACWLHDIIPIGKDDPRRAEAASLSADRALQILEDLGWGLEERLAVGEAIRSHSFSGGGEPTSLEAAVLRDADRLDALGCVGIARLFYVAGCIGSAICHPHDPLARHRSLDERRYAVDHCFSKLTRLPDGMITEPGRVLAEQRWRVVEEFLQSLESELSTTCAAVSRNA